jgi:branched-chain amino acid transport system ATP-binding protein
VAEILNVDSIHTYYGQSHILRGVSFRIAERSTVALLGRNGMGKTTTIRSILGLTPPRQGRIVFKSLDITGLSTHIISQHGLGLVPQGRRIFPSLNVEENLSVAARTRGRAKQWDLAEVYTIFPILKERAKTPGTLLSGGEQQMLAIGRALMTNPDLFLMDEPSEGLAPSIVQELGSIIRQLQERGLSILLVEQKIDLALQISDYVYVLNNGVVVHEAYPNSIRQNEEVCSRYLGVESSHARH